MNVVKHTPLENRLFAIAETQNGYFTYRQAISIGYKSSNFNFYLRRGMWVKTTQGVYRLKNYPVSDDEQYTIWSLWIGEKNNVPIGVYSYLTALAFYDVSETISDKLHVTVPTNFRTRRKFVPEMIIFHREKIDQKDIRYLSGYAITTLSKTLLDLAKSNLVERDQFVNTVIESHEKGYISRDFIFQTPEFTACIPEIKKYIR